jgi:predicted nucleic-acid-binding Zn-ribbon protein
VAEQSKALPRSEIVRFLSAKLQNPRCPCCGGNDFATLNEEDVDGRGLKGRAAAITFPFPAYDIFQAKSTDLIVISCNNCGHVLNFLRAKAIEWLSANPNPKQD